MILSLNQRAWLLLGLATLLILVPIIGGLHHHDHGDDEGGVCWFCVAASAVATLSAMAVLFFIPRVASLFFPVGSRAVAWRLKSSHHRRGPPRARLAQG